MAMAQQRPTTDFGFERVPLAEKARRVRSVFDSVVERYDLMNDLMSAGTHRLWKRFTLSLANLRAGQRALDVAGGSGDLALGLAMRRALKPGGQLLVLEFSQPRLPALKPLYDAYSFRVLPWLGRTVAGDEASYRYLAESIRMHPDADTLLNMMQAAGLEACRYHSLAGGIVAVHRGYRS